MPAKKETTASLPEENLRLWKTVEKTDPRYTSPVKSGGRTFTAIDAYWQTRVATSLWGPYGSTWGLFETAFDFSLLDRYEIVLFSGVFRFPDSDLGPGGEFPIRNSVFVAYESKKDGNVRRIVTEDFAKKVETDTLTKALSRLGFSADVFLGLFEDSRYVKDRIEEEKEKEKREAGRAGASKKAETGSKRPGVVTEEDFLRKMEDLSKAVSDLAKKTVTPEWLVENRLSKEEGWPAGPTDDWKDEDFEAAVKIIDGKMSATTQKEK